MTDVSLNCLQIQETCCFLKPHIVLSGQSQEILARIVAQGLEIIQPKVIRLSDHQARIHYAEHAGKHFFEEVISQVTSADILVFRVKGLNAVSRMRDLVGPTDPKDGVEGEIRHDFGLNKGNNAIHASATLADAIREIANLYSEEELEEVA